MKDLKIYISIASGLLLIYLVALYNQPKPIDWTPTYLKTDKIPYGTYILHQRLGDIFPGSKVISSKRPVYNTLKEYSAVTGGNYILIAPELNLDRNDIQQLLHYMRGGGRVFIASFNPGNSLSNFLRIKIETNVIGDSTNSILSFVNPSYSKKLFRFEKGIGDYYFSKWDRKRASIIGRNQGGKANFIKYKFGKGELFLLAGPRFFTNYSLLKSPGEEYAATVLSGLPVGKQVIVDEFYTSGDGLDDSPLRVIFRYPALNWAYWITLISMVLFVLYEMKRRQRIIPVNDPLKNSTVDFVQVVGQVYYQQRDNRNIALKKILYFTEHLRNRFRVKTTVLDREMAETLAKNSGVEDDLVNTLLEQINRIRSADKVTDRELIELNKNIEKFYKQSR